MLPTELRQFFKRYSEAFNALDANAVAQFYAEPSAIAQGGKVTAPLFAFLRDPASVPVQRETR